MLMDMSHSLTDAFDEHVPVLNDQSLNWPDRIVPQRGFEYI